MSELKSEIKLGQHVTNKDDYWIYDDDGLICGSLGVNEKKVKELIKEVNFRLPVKPTNLTAENDLRVGSFLFRKGTKIYSCKCNQWVGYKDLFCKHCGQKLEWD